MIRRYLAAILVAVCVMLPQTSLAQQAELKHEFRGAWIASVTNLDWPVRGATTASQQAHLIEILDGFQEAGINAVIFQIRPELDALYESSIEPWSYWLTGQQGRAPSPFYDPLQFAIAEAHKRGMELHAWFNPYRAERSVGNYTLDPNHVSVRHPEWTFTVGNYRQLDPGLPEVREYVTEVVMDVVRRYDVDGIHFDDYFYPYAPNNVTDQDLMTFANDTRGFSSIGDWRRDNVNLLIEMLNDSIQTEKPHVKFGISPFGIWRPGNPPGISGTDAYATIYADATAWLRDQTIDYLAPQLYWQFGGGQDFGLLAPWWADQRNDRHMYIGIGLYKADSRTFGGATCCYAANEVPRQIRFTRDQAGLEGTILFRSDNIVRYNSQGIADSLANDLFAKPALTPPMPWKSMVAPGAPENLGYERIGQQGENTIELAWDAPSNGSVDARFYAIYRVEAATPPDFAEISRTSEHLIAVTGETSFVDTPTDARTYYFVSAISSNSIESDAERTVFLADPTSSEDELATSFSLRQNYPNPFNPSTTIEYSLAGAAEIRLSVVNVLGQEVAVLANGLRPAGTHTVLFEATDLPSGSYFYVLETGGHRTSRSMMLLK
jgi:uncharacterized lipoprotein YddW (UPF0748 family)